jgi:Fe-S-cluster containining protein
MSGDGDIVAAPDGSALCADCGLCCNGTLYSNAKAAPDELERLAAAGMPAEEIRGRMEFRLPCPKLEGAHCTIYQERFTICRTFQCALLRRYLGGEVALEEALGLVGKVKELSAKVTAEEPSAATLRPRMELARATASWAEEKEPAERLRKARLSLNLTALHLLLDRNFRNKKDAAHPET